MKISIIAAMSRNRIIGKDNSLIWHLPEDLRMFKRLTTGHHILMGRKTFESIGKPLPKRTSIVLSRSNQIDPEPGLIVASNLEEGISIAESAKEDELFIIGGETIYKQALDKGVANRMYLTKIDHDFEGDAWFPDFNEDDWVKSEESKGHSDTQSLDFSVSIYDKKPY